MGRIWALIAFASTLDWGWPKVVALLVALLGTAVIREMAYALARVPTPWIEIVTLMAAAVMVTVTFAIARHLLAAGPAPAVYATPGQTFVISGGQQTFNFGGATEAQRLQEQKQVETERLRKEQQAPKLETGTTTGQTQEQRFVWLATLASLRNVGVARRNELASLRGPNAEVDAWAKYVAWLQFTLPEIRKLPIHGRHEAHAFETLDRYRLDAAPIGNYETPRIRTIAAMFSTHLERLEEIRKRYTMTWPV